MATESETQRPTINGSRLLDRFLNYVQIETTANPESEEYPSSPGQRRLGKLLVDHLQALALDDVRQDENGLVWATVPATDGGESPTVALIAHLDTSPESPGKDVRPQVIQSYEGGPISLEGGGVIDPEDTEELADLVGMTLITTDGTTLLGGDDKAGVAILVELAAHLMEYPQLPHGPVRLLFTCDEEIGHGTDKIDLAELDAMVAYTVDGGGAGQIDVETFSADAARVVFRGRNIHPAIAKGRMINAVRAAAYFIDLLPRDGQSPETTDEREGFLHPHRIEGGVETATVELILRSFEAEELVTMADQLRQWAEQTRSAFPGLEVDVTTHRQYRNLREGLKQLPEAVTFAEQAFARLDRPVTKAIIRGGTDGSQLTEKGLPTPNLSSGQHNIHALTEFACLDEMVEATEQLVQMLALWSQYGRS